MAVELVAVACTFIEHYRTITTKESLVEKPFHRILIIKLRFHGDMLLTTPVISTLKQNFPAATIDVLLYEETMSILSENHEINTLYGVVNKKSNSLKKLYNFISLIRKLRANQYDLIINLTDQWMIAFLVRLIKVPIRITHDFEHRHTAFWKKSFTQLVPPSGANVVESNLSVLSPITLQSKVTKTSMGYKQATWQRVRVKMDQAGIGENFVVVQPTARQIFKCWDNEKFSQVCDFIHMRGYQIILTSGPGKEDMACIEAIASGCKMPPITALAGKVTFPELGALIDHAKLFIGVDSAPGHMAAAVDTPLICLFGATDHIFWRPWSENMVQFWAGDYQPMPPRENRDRNKRYLSVIPSRDVIEAVEKMLPNNPSNPMEETAL